MNIQSMQSTPSVARFARNNASLKALQLRSRVHRSSFIVHRCNYWIKCLFRVTSFNAHAPFACSSARRCGCGGNIVLMVTLTMVGELGKDGVQAHGGQASQTPKPQSLPRMLVHRLPKPQSRPWMLVHRPPNPQSRPRLLVHRLTMLVDPLVMTTAAVAMVLVLFLHRFHHHQVQILRSRGWCSTSRTSRA